MKTKVAVFAVTLLAASLSGCSCENEQVATDNPSPGISVQAAEGLTTTESGGVAIFTVALGSKPSAEVTIALSISDPSEGGASPASLVFTPDDWQAPQTVTVTGVDDDQQDGPQTFLVITGPAVSADSAYNGLDAADVSVTNTDDDRPGIRVDFATGLTTTEAGETATFTVVLESSPASDVRIPLSSSDDSEGTVSPASLVFTSANWNAPQTVTVTGVDDDLADGPQEYSVITGSADSADLGYLGLDPLDVVLSNTDDETAGITLTPLEGLVTSESGDSATFTVVLNSQPAADVTIDLSSSDSSEGAVSPASITFTSANWRAPQTITVTGVDDDVADGSQAYLVVTAAARSDDPGYAGTDAADVRVSNTDDDTEGVTVDPIAGLVTTEAGGSATFTVVLNSAPTADVAIAVASSDPSEGSVSPALLTFTPANWRAPQTVTISGLDDDVADGSQIFAVLTSPATSADPGYAGIDPADVQVSNTDDDSAGITVAPLAGLVTTEAGGSATFTVVLNSEPTADVTLVLSSSEESEGTVSPTSLTFTALDWRAPQTVTVTGVDDDLADGNQPFTIVIAQAASADLGYAALDPADVELTNTDDETAGIQVEPVSGLVTTEAGTGADFTVVLSSQPTADVTIELSSSDATEGIVSPASLTFTSTNWRAPQLVTVTGVDDDLADGSQPFRVLLAPAASSDPSYSGLNPADVEATNTDDDSAGVTVSPTEGLVTTEAGGTNTFSIVLNSEPTTDVTLALSSSDETEGTVSPASVTFTTLNWRAPQLVTVTGVDDDVADGSQPYRILTSAAASEDPGYAGIDPSDVEVSNTDDDSAGITVAPVAGLATAEGGTTATFTVVLNSEPTGDVTIAVASSDETEGTVSPASLTFTPANWRAPQQITVAGVNDDVADGNQPFRILLAAAISDDPSYAEIDPADVEVSNADDDSAGIAVTPVEGLTTTEGGGSASFTLVLRSEPTANVVVTLSSSDTTEGTVSPASLTFTPANWRAPQAVTITGVGDDVADGNQPFLVLTAAATSDDASYAGIDPADVQVSNTDDDSAGITVTRTGDLETTEAGGSATFTIVLTSEPTADVTVALSSSDTSEGSVSPASVTFTSVNWKAPQTVTINGVDDDLADGNQPFSVRTGAAESDDPDYSGRDAADVSVSNTDNDSAGVFVTPTSGLATTEDGGTATFAIVLNSQPTADVVIAISSSDTTEGTVTPASLTFTSVNWRAPQTVTITGADDDVADGNQPYSILTAAAVSGDPGYSGRTVEDVSLSNTDDDSAGITVTPVEGLSTTEAGAPATFTIVLNSQPTADVTIALASSDMTEGTVSPASLTFTSINWRAPQTVTITGVGDDVADGSQPYSIITAAAVSADSGYSGRTVVDVSISNTDDDSAGITVTPVEGLSTTEEHGTATFTVVLNSEPTSNVVIALSSSDASEGSVSPASLTFTSADWRTPRTVTVTGADDLVADGGQPYSVRTAAAASADQNYSGLDAADVSLTNTDDDSAGMTVAPVSGLRTTEVGGTATFTVVLNSQPTADVTIALSSNDLSEGTVDPASLVFTAADWHTAQTVTVTGVDDALADGDQPFRIRTAPAVSADQGYAGLDAPEVEITNEDNDTASIVVAPINGLQTTEAGGTASFTVVLTSEPTADVTVTLASSNPEEGTASPDSLTFTQADWGAAQTVTLTGVDDSVADGPVVYAIVLNPAESSDPNYLDVDPEDVSATNLDDDVAGFAIVPTSDLSTTEAGEQATFTIALTSQPTADVTITLESNNSAEGTVSPASVSFTADDWDSPQTVTVNGIDDHVADGSTIYSIVTGAAASEDTNYAGMNPSDVALTNADDDAVGIGVTPIAGLTTSELGATATFTVVLASQPRADVTIGLSTSDATEGTVSPASLTFRSDNWSSPQTVTVTGVSDVAADGNVAYSILTAAATSADTGYAGLNPSDVSVTNLDANLATCKAIKAALPTAADGFYTIDPDGTGALPAFRTYCLMSIESGGWTLVQRTVWAWAESSKLMTTYASFYGTTVGAPDSGKAFRVAGRHWPTIGSGDFLIVHYARRANDGASCGPLYYAGQVRWSVPSSPPATMTNLNQRVLVHNTTTFSTTDADYSSNCVNGSVAVPWSYTACCTTCPTYKTGYWTDEPHPMTSYLAGTADDFGHTTANVCGGAAPIVSNSYYGENAMEYYLR